MVLLLSDSHTPMLLLATVSTNMQHTHLLRVFFFFKCPYAIYSSLNGIFQDYFLLISQ